VKKLHKKIKITKIFEFDASHQLSWHEGKCSNLHGHTYKLEVTVSGKLNKNGIVLDFGELKEIVNENVINILDHKHLNFYFENPTAEIMARKIYKKLKTKLPKRVKLEKVVLWETPTSYVIVE